jgi:hypothetical protein
MIRRLIQRSVVGVILPEYGHEGWDTFRPSAVYRGILLAHPQLPIVWVVISKFKLH